MTFSKTVTQAAKASAAAWRERVESLERQVAELTGRLDANAAASHDQILTLRDALDSKDRGWRSEVAALHDKCEYYFRAVSITTDTVITVDSSPNVQAPLAGPIHDSCRVVRCLYQAVQIETFFFTRLVKIAQNVAGEA